jgi:hypothetical protein
MAKVADAYETLAELCDRAEILCVRLHGLINKHSSTRPEVLFDKDMERARKQVCSSYTTVLDGAALMAKKWLTIFKDRAPKIVAELQEDFGLLRETMMFRDDAKTALYNTLTQNSKDLRMVVNTALTEKTLCMVTYFVKLHLLLDPRFYKDCEIKPQDIAILYQTAVKSGQRGGDSADLNGINNLKGYLQLFCAGEALRSVKDDLKGCSDAVGQLLLDMRLVLNKLMSPEGSTQQIVSLGSFSLVDKLDGRLGVPVDTMEGYLSSDAGAGAEGGGGGGGGAKVMKEYFQSARFYMDATYLSQMREWVFFGLVACPNVLKGELAMELLKLVVSDGWRMRVYRDKFVDMHEIWEEHFKFLKDLQKKQKTADGYAGKAKDHMVAIESACMSRAGKFHGVRRAFLRNVLPQFLKVLKQAPGVLGPQYPVLLALLSLARWELEWYYTHRLQVPRKGGQLYKPFGRSYPQHEPDAFFDPKIVVLVSLAEELRHFCQSHARIVSEYFALALRDVHAPELEASRTALLSHNVLKGDVELCLAELQAAGPDSDFLELRKAWHRCACRINSWNPGERVREAVRKAQYVMDLAVRHSRYVDMPAQVHFATSSLRQLWWHAAAVMEDFRLQTLNNDNRLNVDPIFAVSSLRLFNAAVENSHPHVPADRTDVGQASVQLARSMLKDVSE